MADFEVAGIAYKSRRMDAMTEEAVTRKLAPMLNMAIPALQSLKNGSGRIDLSAVDSGKMIGALTSTLSSMPDENARFIIGACLSVCERQAGQTWVPVWGKSANRPMFEDIRAPHMYLISAKVMEDAFRDFMTALGPSFSVEGEASDMSQSDSQTVSTS